MEEVVVLLLPLELYEMKPYVTTTSSTAHLGDTVVEGVTVVWGPLPEEEPPVGPATTDGNGGQLTEKKKKKKGALTGGRI